MLEKNNKSWKQYLQNRVREIRELTDIESCRHCPGHLNPADLPSHGCSGRDLAHDEKWWNGPDFLKCLDDQLPMDPQPTWRDDEVAYNEIINQPPVVTHLLTTQSTPMDIPVQLEKVIDPKKYSKKIKLLHVTALVIRFIKKLRKQPCVMSTETR